MKIKTKLLSCLGAMAWLTVALLPSSAAAVAKDNSTTNYTEDPLGFNANQYTALEWCDSGFKKKGANCCNKNIDDLGHPGKLAWIDRKQSFPLNLINKPYWLCLLIEEK